MTASVVDLNVVSTLDIPVERILSKAADAGMTEVVVIGYDADGNDFFASSRASAEAVLWHLRWAEWQIMQQVDALEEWQ